ARVARARAIRARRTVNRRGRVRRPGDTASLLRSILVEPAGEPLLHFVDQFALLGRRLHGEGVPFGRQRELAHHARGDRVALALELDHRLAAQLEALAARRKFAIAHRALQLQQRLLGVEGWWREAPVVIWHGSADGGHPIAKRTPRIRLRRSAGVAPLRGRRPPSRIGGGRSSCQPALAALVALDVAEAL